MSTVDKFPALEDHKYEREKLFIKEASKKDNKKSVTIITDKDKIGGSSSKEQAGQSLSVLE